MQYDANRNRRRNFQRWGQIQSMADAMQIEPCMLTTYLKRLKEINDRRTPEQIQMDEEITRTNQVP